MKPLPQGSYIIRPFKAYKDHTYVYTYGGTNKWFLSIDEAAVPPANWKSTVYSQTFNSGSGLEKHTLYGFVENFFYPTIALTQSNIPPIFDRGWTFDSQSSGVYVVGISQASFGEQIRPGSFVLTSGSVSILDDGLGRLYTSVSPAGTYIGNIFYSFGIAVISKLGSGTGITANGMGLSDLSAVTLKYRSQLTLYEHSVQCTMEKGEFNYSTNPSLILFSSSSVSGSSLLMNELLSGSLTPYITTIGMYNDNYDLIAVAKVPRPIRRIVEMDQTFVIKFDI
jgi:hypothetical protein